VGEVTLHHLRKTAARDTEEYVFSQLIPYIGNKRKLLDIIHQAIKLTNIENGTFVDLFSGSTVVSRFAKKLGFRVLSNDWEPYSEQIAIGTVVLNEIPKFDNFGGVEKVFDLLNNVVPVEDYVTKHLCPTDDEKLDHEKDRLFFMRKNGMKIDAMRELISKWVEENKISQTEFSYLMSSLLYSVSYVSNTSGVFKGFHRGWGGSNGTAQYRICSDISLKPPILFNNDQDNISIREDAGVLVNRLTGILGEIPDIIYLDPPYNQHPYGSNYHVLNSITLWDKPDFPEKITRGTKSAIRLDWRTERKSAYNSRPKAVQEFQELIDNISSKFILTSYSTEGNIPLNEMMKILGSKGTLRVVKREYVRYRVSPTRLSPKPRNVEFVVITDTNGKPESKEIIDSIIADIISIDSEIRS
jgi:adenine-specific DNA-methyltransferase